MYNKIDFSKIDLTAEPPAEEPARQYYYIAKCRQYVKSSSERLGRTLTSTVVTFGCQVNTVHEIEKSRINAAFCVRV